MTLLYSTNPTLHLPTTFQGDKGQEAKQAQLQTELQAATDAVSAAAWSDVCPRTAIHSCKGRLRSSRLGGPPHALPLACLPLAHRAALSGPLGAQSLPLRWVGAARVPQGCRQEWLAPSWHLRRRSSACPTSPTSLRLTLHRCQRLAADALSASRGYGFRAEAKPRRTCIGLRDGRYTAYIG